MTNLPCRLLALIVETATSLSLTAGASSRLPQWRPTGIAPAPDFVIPAVLAHRPALA